MHKPSEYEIYFTDKHLWYLSEHKEIPLWFNHEKEVYYWIYRLVRKMGIIAHNNGMIPDVFLERLEKIESIRYLRFENISRSCRILLEFTINELVKLRKELQQKNLWREKTKVGNSNILTREGLEIWRDTVIKINYLMYHIKPDLRWEKELERFKKENLEVK